MANIGNSFENSCILTAVGVIAILINSAVITHFGRRRVFLIIGMFLCGLTQLLSAVVYTVQPGTVSTGRAIVGLSVVYIVGYNVRTAPPFFNKPNQTLAFLSFLILVSTCWDADKIDAGNGRDLCLDLGRRVAITALALLHLWPGNLDWILRGMARHLHRPLLHQSSVSQLGPQIRLHLGRALLAWSVSISPVPHRVARPRLIHID